jgi:nucleotide-binding universal stress UspA family protein
MAVIRTILHPPDFSPHSDYAFAVACALARGYDAQLFVLHVAPPPDIAFPGGPPPENYHPELTAALHRIQAPDPRVRLRHRLVEGDADEEIVQTARDIHSDLIVMGTHGRTGLGRLLVGSVAEWVLRRAPCPVLTVKLPAPSEEPSAEQAEDVARASHE